MYELLFCAMTNYLTRNNLRAKWVIVIDGSEDTVRHSGNGLWHGHAQLWHRELTSFKSGSGEEEFWSSVALSFSLFPYSKTPTHGIGPPTLRVCLTPLY